MNFAASHFEACLHFDASTNAMYNQLCAYLKGEQDLISVLHLCWYANALVKANTSTQTIPLCQLTHNVVKNLRRIKNICQRVAYVYRMKACV